MLSTGDPGTFELSSTLNPIVEPSMFTSFIDAWKNAFNFKGLTSRKDYWSFQLISLFVGFLINLLLYFSAGWRYYDDTLSLLSYPIYYGAPNVGDYFPTKSFKSIDINNFQEAVKVIEHLLDSNTYEKSIESLKEARNLVLGKYNFLNRIYGIMSDVGLDDIKSSKQNIVLKSVQSFWKENVSFKGKVKHNIARKLRL